MVWGSKLTRKTNTSVVSMTSSACASPKRSNGKNSPSKWRQSATQRLQSNVVSGNLTSWLHHLDPQLSKEKWTQEENKRLFELQKIHGSRWKEIANYFPQRTDNGIKNQFFSIIRKSLRKACKASNINIGSNIINNVKPKILSEFLNTPLKGNTPMFKLVGNETFRMRDFIQRFAFNRMNEIRMSFEPEERDLIRDCIKRMQNMK